MEPPPPPPSARRSRLRRLGAGLLALVAVLGLAALTVGPAMRHLGDRVISTGAGDGGGFFYGDAFEPLYHWWVWVHQAVRLGNPYMDPFAFGALVGDNPNQMGFPYAPLFGALLVFGIPFAYNAILLLTFPLTFGTSYLWLRSVGLRWAPAACGGLLVAFFPTRVERLSGHYVAWLVALVPLALWTVERAARASTPRRQAGWAAGFAVTLVTIVQAGELYFVLFGTLIAVSYAALRLGPRLVRERPLWIAAGGIVAAFLLVLVVRGWLLTGSYWSGGRPLIEAQIYSPDREAFFRRDPLLGSERFTFLGVLTLALAWIGLIVGVRRRLVWFWAGWIAVIMVFSLGTNTRVFVWLHENTPLLQFARSVTRPLPLAAIGFGLLVALAIQAGLDMVPGRQARLASAAAVVAVAAVAAWDASAIRFGGYAVDGLQAQERLIGGDRGRVISAPVFDTANTTGVAYMFASIHDPRRSANGYSPYAPREAVERQVPLRAVDCGILGREQVAELRRHGIANVVLYPMYFGTPWSAWSPAWAAAALDRTAGATRAGDWRGVTAWRLDPSRLRGVRSLATEDLGAPAPTRQVEPCTGWDAPAEDGTWSRGRPAYLWAHRAPGAPEPRVTLDSGPIPNLVRWGPVDGPTRSAALQGTREIALGIPDNGRWTPVVVAPRDSWQRFPDSPERYGVRLVFPLPPFRP